MIVYNLTDMDAPGKEQTRAQTLPILGRKIPPGEFVEIPDKYGQHSFAGHIQKGLVSVNGLPSWYQRKKLEQNMKKAPVENDEVAEKGE